MFFQVALKNNNIRVQFKAAWGVVAPMKNQLQASLLLIVATLVPLAGVAATVTTPTVEKEKLTQEQMLSQLKSSDLGESYDPSSGSVTFSATDISLPGNSFLKVELRRQIRNATDLEFGQNELGNWSLDIPYVRGIFLDNTGNIGSYLMLPSITGFCGGPAKDVVGKSWDSSGASWLIPPSDYWKGKLLHIPQEVSENLIWGKGVYQGKQVTKTNHILSSCLANGAGIIVTAPDGTRYTFSYVVSAPHGLPPPIMNDAYVRWIYATKVEDRFGNSVSYNYDAGLLRSIVASDGRSITLNYSGKNLISAVANGKTWTYTRTSTNELAEVILPDNRRWDVSNLSSGWLATAERQISFSYTPGHCKPTQTYGSHGSLRTYSMITPEKLKVTYSIENIYHGIYDVKPYPEFPEAPYQSFNNVHCSNRANLVKKTISGPGVAEQVWNYSYSQNGGRYIEAEVVGNPKVFADRPTLGALQNEHLTEDWPVAVAAVLPFSKPDSVVSPESIKTTTIIGPAEKVIYYIDRTFDSPTQDKILAVDVADKTTGDLVSRLESYYTKGELLGDACAYYTVSYPYPHDDKCPVFTNQNSANYWVNLTKTITKIYNSDGTDSYTTNYMNFNGYGLPEKQVGTNNFSSNIRYIWQEYLQDSVNWVLNLPTVSRVGATDSVPDAESEVTYYPWSVGGGHKLQPKEEKSFGQVIKTFSDYNLDGSVKKVEYNSSNRWVNYSNYYRGTPQTLNVPNRYDSATTLSSSAEVNDDGAIKSITDFKGSKKSYGYDNSFRLTSVDIQDPLWADTAITYDYLTAADATLGVVAGQLKQTLTRGNYEKTIFYDALSRPTLMRERDLSSIAKTTRFVNFKYNAKGSPVFSSIKSSSATETLGTATAYDALNRVTSVKEIASGSSKTVTYLAGNKQRIKDFKGNLTTTTFKAFGEPNTQFPEKIEQPKNITTSIAYNIFGNITSVTQGGFTISYIYDNTQKLCKLKRPEVDWTYYDYNAVGDVIWEAQGVPSITTTCDRNLITADKKINYEYDYQGGLWKTTYPDATPSKTATLDVNGNLEKVIFGNDSWVYTYNSQNLVETETLAVAGKTFLLDPGYDSLGQIASLRYPSGKTVSYTKNALGQTEKIGGYVSSVLYHPSGTMKSMTYGNGVTIAQDINNRQLPSTVLANKSDGSKLSDLYYNYDENHNVSLIQNRLNSSYDISMLYDGVDRIESAAGYWGSGSFEYDLVGNIKKKTLGTDSLSYNYDSRNRLASVIGYKTYLFDYDSRGNVIENGYNPFTYNIGNQLTQTNGITYKYDAYGRRITKSKNGKNSFSFYDKSGRLLYRQKENGNHLDYLYIDKDLVTTVESR